MLVDACDAPTLSIDAYTFNQIVSGLGRVRTHRLSPHPVTHESGLMTTKLAWTKLRQCMRLLPCFDTWSQATCHVSLCRMATSLRHLDHQQAAML